MCIIKYNSSTKTNTEEKVNNFKLINDEVDEDLIFNHINRHEFLLEEQSIIKTTINSQELLQERSSEIINIINYNFIENNNVYLNNINFLQTIQNNRDVVITRLTHNSYNLLNNHSNMLMKIERQQMIRQVINRYHNLRYNVMLDYLNVNIEVINTTITNLQFSWTNTIGIIGLFGLGLYTLYKVLTKTENNNNIRQEIIPTINRAIIQHDLSEDLKRRITKTLVNFSFAGFLLTLVKFIKR